MTSNGHVRSVPGGQGDDPDNPRESSPTPYRDAAWTYRRAGWLGVLPIPAHSQTLRLTGWTGHDGGWPSNADITAWCDSTRPDEGGGNIALRMPHDVIGVDVDAYSGKTGARSLANAVARWGPLPDTWISTARDDGISGIRFFRVPEGLRWPGQIPNHIEIIQTVHRYAVVWPSVNPKVDRVYRWYRPDGMASFAPPRPDELPDLPTPWVVGLTGGELAEQVHLADLTHGQVGGWLATRSGGQECRAMATVTERLLGDLAVGSAHESLRRLLGLVRLAEQGHAGLAAALTRVHGAFMAETTNPARAGSARDEAQAQAEWARSLSGAVRRALGSPSVADGEQPDDPCASPFSGLVAQSVEFGPPLIPTPSPDAASSMPAAALPAGSPLEQRDDGQDVADGETDGETTDQDGRAGNGETAVGSSAGERERTSWWPRDLSAVLAGESTEPEPSLLARSDGRCLFYAGKINGLLGESESGKTWILLHAVVQCLAEGLPVLYADFEDTAESVVSRLVALGAKPDAIRDLFDYLAPDETLHQLARSDLGDLLARGYALIGLDGYNAAMTLLGLDLGSNPDVTKFAQSLLRPMAGTGAAVVTVDHVSKDKETRGKGGIGAQAKRAMMTGSAVGVDVLAPFGRGQTGKLKLTVDKDRPGHVRGFAENSKNAGIAILESGSNGSVNVRIDPSGSPTAAAPVRGPWRPTAMMEKVTRFLSVTDGMLSQTQIENGVDGRTVTIRRALELLVEEGYVSRHPGQRNSLLHRYERTFRELDELAGATAVGSGGSSGEADDESDDREPYPGW